jgi:hypothetical protein
VHFIGAHRPALLRGIGFPKRSAALFSLGRQNTSLAADGKPRIWKLSEEQGASIELTSNFTDLTNISRPFLIFFG